MALQIGSGFRACRLICANLAACSRPICRDEPFTARQPCGTVFFLFFPSRFPSIPIFWRSPTGPVEERGKGKKREKRGEKEEKSEKHGGVRACCVNSSSRILLSASFALYGQELQRHAVAAWNALCSPTLAFLHSEPRRSIWGCRLYDRLWEPGCFSRVVFTPVAMQIGRSTYQIRFTQARAWFRNLWINSTCKTALRITNTYLFISTFTNP